MKGVGYIAIRDIVKAVGDYYDERIKVKKLSDDRFEITFL
jgi:hypothetical protein